MIPTEEPKPWPWYIRVIFVIIGMIALPFTITINFVKYLKKRLDEK